MLGRNYRDTLFCYVVAFLQASFVNMWKMMKDGIFVNVFHGKPYMVGSFFFHLFLDCLCYHISWKQFVDKAFFFAVIKHCTLSANGLGDQKSAARFLGIQCCGVDLYIVQMFQTYIVFFRNIQGITGKVWIVGGMLISSADSAACKDGILRIDFYRKLSAWLNFFLNFYVFSCFHCFQTCFVCFCRNCLQSDTFAVFYKDILHGSIFQNGYIFKFQNLSQKFFGDFFSCNIFMIKDPRFGMRAFSCIGKIISIHLKIHTVAYQVIDYISGSPDHNVYGFFSVFVMSCFHGVFKIAVIIIFITEYTDPALCQEGIAASHIFFCDDHDFFVSWKFQCAEHSRNTCSYDYYVCLDFHCFRLSVSILQVPASAPAVSLLFLLFHQLHGLHFLRFSEHGALFPEILFSCFCRLVRFL